MKILLIDADSVIPNIALCKLNAYYKDKAKIDFLQLNIPYYPRLKKQIHYIETSDYDKVFCSVVFNNNIEYIKGNNIEFGGTGTGDLNKNLPKIIENQRLDYSIYPTNDTSYGFITRGCIRNCSFCLVPRKEGYIKQVATIDQIVQHKKVKFLDNNILALPNHKVILKELVDKKIYCQFNQGLDIRLIDEENSYLLSQMKYMGEYIFAFDNLEYLFLIESKLNYLTWRKDWQLKFFVYIHPNMKLSNIVKRIEWLRDRKCLPYIMRDITCWESENSKFYTDIASWCNQVHVFKKLYFDEFLLKRHPNNSIRCEDSFTKYKNNC